MRPPRPVQYRACPQCHFVGPPHVRKPSWKVRLLGEPCWYLDLLFWLWVASWFFTWGISSLLAFVWWAFRLRKIFHPTISVRCHACETELPPA